MQPHMHHLLCPYMHDTQCTTAVPGFRCCAPAGIAALPDMDSAVGLLLWGPVLVSYIKRYISREAEKSMSEQCGYCRDEAQQVQEEQQYHKLHQKQMQAEQDLAWMHSVPDWHEADLVGQNKPWTVPSQLLTAEEEVRLEHLLLCPMQFVCMLGFVCMPGFVCIWAGTSCNKEDVHCTASGFGVLWALKVQS